MGTFVRWNYGYYRNWLKYGALFQTQSNELSTITQKEKLFKDAERQWNTLSSEKGAPGRKVDFEIYKSILYNLEIRKVYLDSKLSLEKFSSIVGTNTTYLSNAVNNYFGCNFKQLLNKYRVEYAKSLLLEVRIQPVLFLGSVGLHPKAFFMPHFIKWSAHLPCSFYIKHHPNAEKDLKSFYNNNILSF